MSNGLKSAVPTIMTLGNRTYEILGYLRGHEESVTGETMAKLAKKMNANLGKEECLYVWKHRHEIPAEMWVTGKQGRIVLLFPAWQYRGRHEGPVACIYYFSSENCFYRSWAHGWCDQVFCGNGRLLRRTFKRKSK